MKFNGNHWKSFEQIENTWRAFCFLLSVNRSISLVTQFSHGFFKFFPSFICVPFVFHIENKANKVKPDVVMWKWSRAIYVVYWFSNRKCYRSRSMSKFIFLPKLSTIEKTSRTKSENGLALHMEKSQLKKKYVKSQLKLFQFKYASLK